jgi:predicted protein tyrosine phosphatase
MFIKTFPRSIIEKFMGACISPVRGDWALISIYSDHPLIHVKDYVVLEKMGCTSHISVCFDDVTDKDIENLKASGSHHTPFDRDKARQIINFLDSLKNIEALIIHCAAGISRSGAVGVFACRYLNLDETEFRSQNKVCPNHWILGILSEEAGLNRDYEKVWMTPENERLRSRIRFGEEF